MESTMLPQAKAALGISPSQQQEEKQPCGQVPGIDRMGQ
jgi:hypothetical protein